MSRNVAEVIVRGRDDGATKTVQGVGSSVKGMVPHLAAAGAAFVAVRRASAMLTEQLGQAIQTADENIRANQHLVAALTSTQQNTDEAREAIEAAAGELEHLGITSGAAAEEFGALLLNLGFLARDVPQVMRVAHDLGAAINMSADAAARNLARTLQGDLSPQLARIVPELNDLTEEQLRAGDAIDFLGERFGGFAQASVTAIDRMRTTKDLVGEIRATFVQATLENESWNDALDELNRLLSNLKGEFEDNVDAGEALAKALAFVLESSSGLLVGFADMADAIPQMSTGFSSLARKASLLFPALAQAVDMTRRLVEGTQALAERAGEGAESQNEWARVAREAAAAAAETAQRISDNTQANIEARESLARLTDQQRSHLENTIRVNAAGQAWTQMSKGMRRALIEVGGEFGVTETGMRNLANEIARSEQAAQRMRDGLRDTSRGARDAADETVDAFAEALAEGLRLMQEETAARQENQLRIADIQAAGQIRRIEDERQRIEALRQWQIERLNSQLEKEMITEDEHRRAREIAEAEHRERLADYTLRIEREKNDRMLAAAEERTAQEAEQDRIRAQEHERLAMTTASSAERAAGLIVDRQKEATGEIISQLIKEAAAYAMRHMIAEGGLAGLIAAPFVGAAAGALVAGARRMHTGGMVGDDTAHTGRVVRSDDRMIRAQAGEGVLSRVGVAAEGGPAAVAQRNAGIPAGGGQIVLQVHAMDAESIIRSGREGGELNRALQNMIDRGDIRIPGRA